MSPASIIRLVAGREIRERGRSKEMVVSTIVSLVVIGVLVVLAGASDDDGPSYDVGTIGERPAEVADVMRNLAAGADSDDSDAVDLTVREVADRADAERRLADGDLDAVLAGDEILVESELDSELQALVQAAHRELAISDALAEAGASPGEVAAASPEPLATRALDPDDDAEDRTGLATVGTFLLYAQLFGFGYWVASGIVEEKSSRVVEVLLAKAGPRPLLAGKILGIGAVALAQLVVFVAGGLALATAVGTVDLPPGTLRVAVELVGWFLLGFAIYACVFAMGGAIASRVEELQNTTGPITVVAMGAFFAALAAGNDPEGLVARIATFVPVSAPMVLPIRSAAGSLPAWEAAVAAALLVVTAVVVVRLAARIYAGGALFTRGQLKLRDALARGAEGSA